MCDKPTPTSLLSLLARADAGASGTPRDPASLVSAAGAVTGGGVFMQEGDAVPAGGGADLSAVDRTHWRAIPAP